jgi:predicted Zn-dependent protease
MRQTALAQEQWRRAFEEARGNAARILAIGDFALRLNDRDRAVEAYNLLLADDLHRLTAYRRLAQAYESARDTERMRVLMREWSARFPDDPLPDNAYSYLSALLRRDLDEARDRSARLLDRFPTRLGYRATRALLELRHGQPRNALQLFERTRFDLHNAAPQTRLIYGLVLDANGRRTQAQSVVQGLRPDRLLPEEQDLLRRLMVD